jgi:hypothetical protein
VHVSELYVAVVLIKQYQECMNETQAYEVWVKPITKQNTENMTWVIDVTGDRQH